MQIITLTTDFGTQDWFVGTMKGVILGIAPRAAIVDITHEIPAGDIRAGAFALAAGYRFFPKGTVHVAVVDPGVGGARKAIAVQTANYLFVGPDNGVLFLRVGEGKNQIGAPARKHKLLFTAGQPHFSRARHFRSCRGASESRHADPQIWSGAKGFYPAVQAPTARAAKSD